MTERVVQPELPSNFDLVLRRFLDVVAVTGGVSPMDRALKIARAMDHLVALAALSPRIGDMKGSIGAHREALRKPAVGQNDRLVLESLIQMLDREADTTIADARAVRAEWWSRFGEPCMNRQSPHTNNRDPERPLVVGCVSSNFKHSSAGNCLQAVVLNHSDAVRPIFYSTSSPSHVDPMTWVFQASGHLVDVTKMNERAFAQRVRADKVDILIDCMGFTYGNRLCSFAERPAPIQATGWGYATGTIPAMDYILLDAITAGNDLFYEQIVNLPCVISYVPPAMFCPDVQAQPKGPVTFGAFHCFIKINPEVLQAWKRILDGVKNSRIVFKGKEYGDVSLQRSITDVLGAQRCEFWPTTQQMEHFDAYKHIDLVLDPWPQTGGITTCEALHMGVPSVTLNGARTVQRAAASILDAVGCQAGITNSVDEYVTRAITLVTGGRRWLSEERPKWRERLRASRVCAGYVNAVEDIYRQLWRAWCAREKES